MANIQESYPSQTTGLGVAAKIAVQGNLGTNTKPGYNNVVLSVSGANGQTTFQLNPQLQDVSGAEINPGTSFVLSSVASPSPGPLTLTGVTTSVNGTAAYAGTITGGASNALVGFLFTVAGFVTNPSNNGVFVCTASSASVLTLANANAITETVAATATSEEGTAVYTGTIGVQANSLVGQTFVVAGFTNAGNNGTFICTANNGSTTITLENDFAVSESHAATAVSQESAADIFVLSAAANASAGTTVYTGTIGVAANSLVGKSVTIAGFVTNPVNNGTFVVTANNGSTTITVSNTAGVAESHAATATVTPQAFELTYVAYPAKTDQRNTYNPSGVNVHVATVSSSGLITAVAPGGIEVEVSYPTFDNAIGDIVSSGNIMNGLPIMKIYATVNVQVLP